MPSLLKFYRDFALSLFELVFGRLFPTLKIPPADLTGKVAIITGGNSGVGLQIGHDIARQGATVYLACRNASKAKEAASQITSTVPSSEGRIHILSVDTSLLSSVRDFAETVKALNIKIDLLFHNAGIGSPPPGVEFTSEGFPMLYTTNFLGSFLLTHLLEPYLAQDARIVLTSSTGHYSSTFSSDFSLQLVKERVEPGFHVPAFRFKSGRSSPNSVAYSQTKAMQVAFAKLLQKHFDRETKGSGYEGRRLAHSFAPGFTMTPIFGKTEVRSLWKDTVYWVLRSTAATLATDISQGTATAVWLSCTQDKQVVGNGNGGAYWLRMTRRLSNIDMMSEDNLERLWLRWEADCGIGWR